MAIQIERITLKEASARYLRCDEMKAKAKSTQANTKSTLRILVAFLGSYIQVHTLERSDMNRFFDDRSESWGNGAYNGKLGILRTFFTWCRMEGYAYPDWDPLRGRKTRPYVAAEKIWISTDQYEAGRLVAPDARDRGFWDFAWHSGCRANEITRLRVGDIDFRSGRYRKNILKKRGGVVVKIKPLGTAEEPLREWLDWYTENQALANRKLSPESYLFPSRLQALWNLGDGSIYEAVLDAGHPVRVILRPDVATQEPWDITRRINLRLNLNPDLRLGVHVSRRSGITEEMREMEAANIPRPMARARVKLDHETEATTMIYTGKDHDEELAEEWYHRDGKYFQQRQAAKAAAAAVAAPAASNVVQLFPRRNVS